jgi:16S rRNA (adenine1518-N6/adenine1519-N6)-dimethyltransferase
VTSRLPPGPDPTSAIALRSLFRQYGFRPRRSLGQTFLTDANIVAKIVAATELAGTESVLEIGPGAGAVTRALAAAAARVMAIEIDPTLVAILRETVGDAAQVIQADVLAVDWPQLLGQGRQGRWRVVANLPYAITGPAILHLLAARDWVERLVIMVQAEVAERLMAPPGGRERGLLSVVVQAACQVKLVWRVARTCFWPQPAVDSAILGLSVRRPQLVPDELQPAFMEVVRAGFAVRRKTLLNALAQSDKLGLSKQDARRLLDSCGIDESRRAETLSELEFLTLAEAVAGRGGEAPR